MLGSDVCSRNYSRFDGLMGVPEGETRLGGLEIDGWGGGDNRLRFLYFV